MFDAERNSLDRIFSMFNGMQLTVEATGRYRFVCASARRLEGARVVRTTMRLTAGYEREDRAGNKRCSITRPTGGGHHLLIRRLRRNATFLYR